MTRYRITATYDECGQRSVADADYAMGQYARVTFASADEAEEIADDLRSDVGDVVDASVEYEVVEADDEPFAVLTHESADYVYATVSRGNAEADAYASKAIHGREAESVAVEIATQRLAVISE